MNYRHLYHAGNFADVFKHVLLVALVEALSRKDKPFCYLDTHAGIGRYDLSLQPAQTTREFDAGILQLLKDSRSRRSERPPQISAYLDVIAALNPADPIVSPRFYPGSPLIVRHFLRPQDRMILTELHPEDVQMLKQEFANDKQVAVHALDGYQGLKAFLPPKEKRGLIFIDPPYEQKDELQKIISELTKVWQHFASGVYAIWYPITDRNRITQFYRMLSETNMDNILLAELGLYPEDSPVGFRNCGMAIINPPWQIDAQLKILVAWLWQALSPEKLGQYSVRWLKKS